MEGESLREGEEEPKGRRKGERVMATQISPSFHPDEGVGPPSAGKVGVEIPLSNPALRKTFTFSKLSRLHATLGLRNPPTFPTFSIVSVIPP